jgi:hypothetical protein
MKSNLFSLIIIASVFSCNNSSNRDGVVEAQFAKYWYQGKAEINVFELKQMRYGEAREGKAVMIFVTEDFSKRKQIKLDDPSEAGADAQKVLKLNMTREFVTGIYPYHSMLSVFTPVFEDVNSPKINVSMTEWCGQAFSQMNWKNNGYQTQIFSYFESEGDQEFKISGKSEDELFNLIRLNPDLIKEGEKELIPSLVFQRFSHIQLKEETAVITKKVFGSAQAELEVNYPDLGRTLVIRYQSKFPYEILSWQETQLTPKGEKEVTSAVRRRVQLLDYWNRNTSADKVLRESLKF